MPLIDERGEPDLIIPEFVAVGRQLVALGGDPAGVAAGMLLFRGFTYLMEIPVGGVMLAVWSWLGRRTGPERLEAVAG